MLRRHPILVVCSLLLLAGIAALGVALANFDLDRYRGDLEKSLSATLGRPVQLGHARFALHGGIALEFSDVRIGARAEEGIVTARRLALRLEILPLLIGRFTFNRLIVEQPDILLVLATPAAAATSPPAATRELFSTLDALLETTLVRSLMISDGRLRLNDRRQGSTAKSWELVGIDAQLRNLGRRGPIDIRCEGSLRFGEALAPFEFSGSLDLPGTLTQWQTGKLDLDFDAGPFGPEAAAFFGLSGAHGRLEGRASIKIHLAGIPREGLDFRGEVRGKDLQITLPALYRAPLVVERLRLEGRWISGETEQALELHALWNGLRLDNHTRWRHGNTGDVIDTTFTLPETPLTELAQRLPDALLPAPLLLLQRSLRGGTLAVPTLQFTLQPSPAAAAAAPYAVTLQQCVFRVAGGEMELPGLGLASAISLAGSWRDGQLAITSGSAAVAGGPLRFGGTFAAAPEPSLDLKADGRSNAAALLERLIPGANPNWRSTGTIPYSLAVKGTLDRLFLDFRAELSQTELFRGDTRLKQARTAGELLIAGTLHPEHLELSHLRLAIPLADLRAEGTLSRRAPHAGRLTIDLGRLDLSALQSDIGALNLLQPRGDISGRLNLERTSDGKLHHGGLISFRDLSLHLGGAVADVSQASGRIRIGDDGLLIEHVSGRVGTSLLSGSGSLGRPDAIRLDLSVRGEAIRARDLVFRSEQQLRSVNGRVLIDGNGIDFIDVHAGLAGGTSAVVNGRLRDYAAPQVELDIVAEQAVIEEVVALWHGPPHPVSKPSAPLPQGTGSDVTIRALARKGDMYGLLFSDGEGIIRYQDGRLIVAPLRIKSGAGHCTGQVVVRDLHAEHALLTISGHLVNADAAGVYNQLLKRPGLVTGALSGDFLIAGRTGDFFAGASGGGSVRIDDGVLLRFPILAKVFSVLNVSQIFALRLPDMATEGMPFKRISGTFSIERGLLRTEDLVADSPAMNLALLGSFDLSQNRVDCVLGVKPLRTVDKIISSIPLAGWVLTGKEKALVTAQFTVTGSATEPVVKAAPMSTLSDLAVGFFKRAFGLPGKMIEDLEGLGAEKRGGN